MDKPCSNDSYLKLGLSFLLTPEFIENKKIQIVDMDTVNVLDVKDIFLEYEELIFLASNDIDYYIASSFFRFAKIKIIDRKCFSNGFLSYIIAGNEKYAYKVKFRLSEIELNLLFYFLSGLSKAEIMEKLNISMKTFYTRRQNLIRKLQFKNRIVLYYYILKYMGGDFSGRVFTR